MQVLFEFLASLFATSGVPKKKELKYALVLILVLVAMMIVALLYDIRK